MPVVPSQPACHFSPFTTSIAHPVPMESQYQYPAETPASYNHVHDDRDDYSSNISTFSYNSEHDIHNSNIGSKQANPVPYINSSGHHTVKVGSNSSSSSNNHDSETMNESQPVKTHKGKIFQCTGFGECRMVFTRSEHLARHARKHTGEKPFQCVVDGCMRMFSRFDNMVQHTQTHTKGAHPGAAEEIANRIALESRRKSEAGLLGGSGLRRASKGLKTKRGSISSASGSESSQKPSRHECMQSVPMLNMTATITNNKRSSTPGFPSPVTPSSAPPLSPMRQTRQRSKTVVGNDTTTGKIRKRRGSIRGRRGSLESSIPHTTTESWYASKLHHRPSLDYGLDQHVFFDSMENYHDVNHMESVRLPPVDYYKSPFGHHRYQSLSSSSSSFSRPRHPLSPEHSLPSDDMDSDDGSVIGYHSQHPSGDDLRMVPSMDSHHLVDPLLDDCTLPPLRHTIFSDETKPRLPSISFNRPRSQIITSGATTSYIKDESSYSVSSNKTRRLSLVDLNAPIQEANVAAHHSMLPHTGHTPGGVDVSEDEIRALEAFGKLWSQGRDIETNDRRRSTTPSIKTEFAPCEVPVPGPDSGRRPLLPPFGDDVEDYMPFHHSPTAMDL